MTAPVPWPTLRAALVEFAPMLRRCGQLDPDGLARLVARGDELALFARLPFAVLAARTLPTTPPAGLDVTVRTVELLAWTDAAAERAAPHRCDEHWRGGLPPSAGWQRVETVGDDLIRPLVRAGALALKDAGRRGPHGRSDPQVADALLDSIVLTATSGATRVEISLRMLSALTRMGFLARGSNAHLDLAGRWTRVAGAYGSIYAEAAGGLALSG